MGIIRIFLTMLLISLLFAGCGGGGGGDDSADNRRVSASMATAGLDAAMLIGGLQVTLNIPPGITVKTDPVSGEVAAEVVQVVGVTDPATVFVGVTFLPPTATAGGQLKFIVIDVVGFASGELIRVSLEVLPGAFPTASDFSLSDFAASDLDGRLLTGLAPVLTTRIY